MSFKVAARPVVGFPISVDSYDENGEIAPIQFVAQYKRVKRKEIEELIDSARNTHLEANNQELLPAPKWKYKTDEEFLLDRMCGWSGLTDEKGTDLEFSKAELKKLLADYGELVKPLFDGFFHAHSGARAKN